MNASPIQSSRDLVIVQSSRNCCERGFNANVNWVAYYTSRSVERMTLKNENCLLTKIIKVATWILGGFIAIPLLCMVADGTREICRMICNLLCRRNAEQERPAEIESDLNSPSDPMSTLFHRTNGVEIFVTNSRRFDESKFQALPSERVFSRPASPDALDFLDTASVSSDDLSAEPLPLEYPEEEARAALEADQTPPLPSTGTDDASNS